MDFVATFEREYSTLRPNFVSNDFMDALQRSSNAFKLLFVYLHSPEHPDTPLFYERTLCSETLMAFVNENFVSWGGSIRNSERFKMSNSLKASQFSFCAVVMAAINQRIELLQQFHGYISYGSAGAFWPRRAVRVALSSIILQTSLSLHPPSSLLYHSYCSNRDVPAAEVVDKHFDQQYLRSPELVALEYADLNLSYKLDLGPVRIR